MVKEWNVTPLENLNDLESPQARALDWILAMDDEIDWDRVDWLKEKFALATLFYATNGEESWIKHDGWLSLESICSWYGVTCRDGAIRRLDLSANGLQSSIPSELALLNLESLGLYSNDLAGTIPRELYRMGDLGKSMCYSRQYRLSYAHTFTFLLSKHTSILTTITCQDVLIRALEI